MADDVVRAESVTTSPSPNPSLNRIHATSPHHHILALLHWVQFGSGLVSATTPHTHTHTHLLHKHTHPTQGTEDEVIHISCGRRLLELCPNKATPLWAAGYGHQDLEMCSGYLPSLENFLAKVAGQQYLHMPAGPGATGPAVVAQQQLQQQGQAVGGAPAPAAPAAAAAAAAQQRLAAVGSGPSGASAAAGAAGAGSAAATPNGLNGHQAAAGNGAAGGLPASASGGRRS